MFCSVKLGNGANLLHYRGSPYTPATVYTHAASGGNQFHFYNQSTVLEKHSTND